MKYRHRQRENGFSIIELMIGMLLGIVLLAGAIEIFLAAKRSYTEVEQVSVLSDNAKFAERLLADAVLHTGFFGEVPSDRIEFDADLTAVASDCTGRAAAYDLANYIFAAVADGDGNAIGCITDAEPGTHVLVAKSVSPAPFTDGPRIDLDPANPATRDGVIDTPSGLVANQTYIMTNDTLGIMFDGADTAPDILTGGDVPGGVAWAYRYEVFYVRAGDTPQLARKTLGVDAGTGNMTVITENLVEGVEELRLRFGLDVAGAGDGEVDTYTSIAGVGTNWDKLGSIEISVLVRSAAEDNTYSNTKSYSMAGASVTAADNFRRVLITTNMSLRNPKLLIRGGAS